jgi:hypothetical protein
VRADVALRVAYLAWVRAGKPGPDPEQLQFPHVPRECEAGRRADKPRFRSPRQSKIQNPERG